MGWFSAKNLAAVGLAPFTGGASLLAAETGDGKGVLGELTGANSAARANEKNIEYQNYWNQQNINLANTAHQRQLADLKAAGLNPVLSGMGGSGATTPALESPTVQNEMPGGYLGQLGQVAGIAGGVSNIAMNAAKAIQIRAETANKLPAEIKNINADTNKIEATAAKTIAETQKTNAEITNVNQQFNLLKNEEKEQILKLVETAQSTENEAQKQELEKKFYNTWFGKSMKYIGLTFGEVSKILGVNANFGKHTNKSTSTIYTKLIK